MLQNIRNNLQGTLAKVIIAIIVVPFALFGIDSFFGGAGQAVVAEVDGTEITENQLRNEISRQQQALLRQRGDDVDPAALDESRLREPALKSLVERQMLLERARALGLYVGEANVDQMILSMEEFQVDGQFSPDAYRTVLRGQGFTPATFKELLRNQLLLNQLNAAVAGTEFVTRPDLQRYVALLAQTRSFDYQLIDSKRFLDEIEISEAQAREYYSDSAEQFMTPEQVRVAWVELTPEQFLEPVDEDAVRTAFNTEMETFAPAVERRAAHILLKTGDERSEEEALAAARELSQQLDGGTEFSELASQKSEDIGAASTGGDLGFSGGDAFPPAFEAALAELEVGEVSAPVVTDAGVHLIKLTEIIENDLPQFEDRRAAIAERLRREQAEVALIQNVEELNDLAFNAGDLESPAAQLGLKVRRSDWMSRNQGEGVFSDARLRAVAFSEEVLESGHNSEVIELSPERFVALRVLEHRAAEQQPFDEVRAEVFLALETERALQMARDYAQTLLEDPEAADDWSSATGAHRAAPDVPPGVLELAFSLPHPDDTAQTGSRVLNDASVAAVVLREVTPGELDALQSNERRALRAQILQSMGRTGFGLFMNNVVDDAEVDYL